MTSTSLPQAPTTQSTSRLPAPDTTPSKRKGSPLGHQELPYTKAQSTPNLLGGKEHSDSSLKTPDRPVSYKRARSASGRSPGPDAVASNDETATSPYLRTPNSCTRQDNYKYEKSRLNHLRNCRDPNCKMRYASMQPSALEDHETDSSNAQGQQHEDVFTTAPSNNHTESIRSTSGDDAHHSSDASPCSKPRSDTVAKTVNAAGELHEKSPGAYKAADPRPEQLRSEQPPCQEKQSPGKTRRSNRDERPVGTLRMHNKLTKNFERRLSPEDEEGHIYVMRDVERPHLCKIGRAKESELRVGTLEKSCGLQLELIYSKSVEFYTRTELLIQAYLSDLCKPYDCGSCGRTHGEWFEIPDELAKAAVKKWTDFMSHERPYDPISKNLKPFWSVWLNDHGVVSADLNVEEFRTRWDRIISPSALNHHQYEARALWDILWKFFWPAYATIAWTVAFVAFKHPVAFLLMAASAIGTFVSMSHDFHLLRHASVRSKRRGLQ